MKPILVSSNEDLLDRLTGRKSKPKDDAITIIDSRGDPYSILGEDVCIRYGIETMQDLADFMQSVTDEDVFYEDLEDPLVFDLTPVSGYVPGDMRKIKASFYCKMEGKHQVVTLCFECKWYDSINKETLILSCSY